MFKLLKNQFPREDKLTVKPRPYINHAVTFKKKTSFQERSAALEKAGYNVFFFPSKLISGGDFLSDSGTTAMTNKQWAALHYGDEAYGSNKGYFLLRDEIQKTFGDAFFSEGNTPNAFIFHQGRACEDALFSLLGKTGTGLVIPSNGHFDTTQANIEANRIQALNLFSPELKNKKSNSHFKGNMDTERLQKLLETSHANTPLIYLTITNNTGGGQPVSLENIREVCEYARHYDIPLFLDACRFAENAWFIKRYEKGYAKKSIATIVQEIFSYADGFTISFKKDGLVNMGGGLFIRESGLFIKKFPELPDALMNYQIIKEGHPSYGGLTGRDIMALVEGLKTVVSKAYLDYRVKQVHDFGECMSAEGLPVIRPVGGHAVYLDMNAFFEGTNMKPGDFGGISFTALLLALYGHRACELGNFAFGTYDPKNKAEKFPEVNFVRFAIPRLLYEEQDLVSTVLAVKALYENRDHIPAADVVYGKDLPLRHFKARFKLKI